MKKYAVIITCLAMFSGSLLAQTSSGGTSGAGTTGGTSGTGTESGTQPGGATTGAGTSSDVSGSVQGGVSSGTSIQEPSGAQPGTSGQTGVGTPGAAGTTGTTTGGGVGVSGTTGAGTGAVGGVSGTAVGGIAEPSGAAQPPGTVTIQGTVSSEQERRDIERHVRMAQGVRSVVNMLRVAGETPGTTTPGGTGGTGTTPQQQPGTSLP